MLGEGALGDGALPGTCLSPTALHLAVARAIASSPPPPGTSTCAGPEPSEPEGGSEDLGRPPGRRPGQACSPSAEAALLPGEWGGPNASCFQGLPEGLFFLVTSPHTGATLYICLYTYTHKHTHQNIKSCTLIHLLYCIQLYFNKSIKIIVYLLSYLFLNPLNFGFYPYQFR